MKSYEEMARDLFARREEYERQQQRKRSRRKTLGLCAAGLALVTISGLGIWKSGVLSQSSENVQMLEREKEEDTQRKRTKEESTGLEKQEEIGGQSEIEDVGIEQKVLENIMETPLERSSENSKKSEDTLDLDISGDLEFLSENAEEIVTGIVQNVTYHKIEDVTWTKVDIQITDVLKGSLKKKEKISVYQVKSDEEGVLSIEGETSVFYLSQISEDSSLLKSGYERVGGKYGELKTAKDSNKLLQYGDSGTKEYTWKQIRKYAER